MSYPNEDCPKIRQHLALYAGRDLEQPLCAAVERHVEQCLQCSTELEQAFAARQRIAVLGAQTAQAVEPVDLWPAIRDSRAKERATEAAVLAGAKARAARVDRSLSWRAWIPIALAAAAVLMIALRSSFDSQPPRGAPIVEVVNPAPVAPNLAPGLASSGAVEADSSGLLRRANPGEERLRDSSSPLGVPRSLWLRYGEQNTPNALAGDKDLR